MSGYHTIIGAVKNREKQMRFTDGATEVIVTVFPLQSIGQIFMVYQRLNRHEQIEDGCKNPINLRESDLTCCAI